MPKFFKDPLLHFLAIGAAMFGLYAWHGRGTAPAEPERGPIVVGAAQVQGLIDAVTILNNGRPPSEAELKALIEPTIREEVLYREALALGLDENDAEVRRRLVQKMTFLTQDLGTEVPVPDDATLEQFLASHAETFAIPDSLSFEQRCFSSKARGSNAQRDALAALAALRAGRAAPSDDSCALEKRYEHAARSELEDWFGADGAAQLFAAPLVAWQGPLESQDGFYLVRVSARTPAHAPELAEVRDRVVAAYRSEQRHAAEEAAYQAMRAKYDIVIEMPEEHAE